MLSYNKEHGVPYQNLVKINKKEKRIIHHNQEYQKGVDVALVTELLRMAREDVYDSAIVVSGDNDYSSAVDCVKSMGRRVEVASFKDALGYDLKQVADKLTFLDNIIEHIKRTDQKP